MSFYTDRRKTADTLLKKYGRSLTLRDNDAGDTYNPATGAIIAGSAVDYPCVGIIYPSSKGRRPEGGIENALTLRAILSAEGLGTVPTTNQQLVASSQVYEIKSVSPLEPAGITVLYELSVAL